MCCKGRIQSRNSVNLSGRWKGLFARSKENHPPFAIRMRFKASEHLMSSKRIMSASVVPSTMTSTCLEPNLKRSLTTKLLAIVPRLVLLSRQVLVETRVYVIEDVADGDATVVDDEERPAFFRIRVFGDANDVHVR